ncbi:MAG: hypothetical protein JWP87_330 [Labilithrix sp.]|nr:hypothetical protein [Labilithrix sp.]
MTPARGAKWPPFDMNFQPPQTQRAAAYLRAIAAIRDRAGSWLTEFHHIGSSSIPGMPGTTIIDILAPVDSLPLPPEARAALDAMGFVHENDMRDPNHLMLGMGHPLRLQHLHVTVRGSQKIRQWLTLRDYLRSDPRRAAEYAAVKNDASSASKGVQVEYFTKKAAFVVDLVGHALTWDEQGRPPAPPCEWPETAAALTAHDPSWASDYASAAEEISIVARQWLPELHHIGATAVPGLVARPVLDILAPIAPDADIDALRRALAPIGYVFEKSPRAAHSARLFGKGFPTPRFHLHVVDRGRRLHRESLALRDYLRNSATDVAAFSEIKRIGEAREAAGCGGAYERLKRAFSRELLLTARIAA